VTQNYINIYLTVLQAKSLNKDVVRPCTLCNLWGRIPSLYLNKQNAFFSKTEQKGKTGLVWGVGTSVWERV
jgi:hypothetical protein